MRAVSADEWADALRGESPSAFLATVAAGPLVALDVDVDAEQPTGPDATS